MIAPRSKTPTVPCTCVQCGTVRPQGEMIAEQTTPGGARIWRCPHPCWSTYQRELRDRKARIGRTRLNFGRPRR